MRSELELIEKIEQYLKGEMSFESKAAFEKQIANDPALQEEVRLQQEVMLGMERTILKQKIQTAGRLFRFRKNLIQWGIGGFGIVVVVTAAFFFSKAPVSHNYEGTSLPEMNERGEKLWASADSNIAAQTFIIDGSKDTVIATKGGIIMAVPANGFLNENGKPVVGKVELTIKEALDAATMMKAGLSTNSGNDLLETGGMFFLDARKDKQILKIDPAKAIYAEIPTDSFKPGMQLFSGERMPNGTIDWVNPKPLEKDLISVDIQSLNFYPPHYLDSLQQWGYDRKNKPFTDSLYFSFACLFSRGATADSAVPKPSNEYVQAARDTATKNMTLDGRILFQSKCSSCHDIFKNATGPRLGGLLNNDFYKGDIKKITEWTIHDYSAMALEPHHLKLHRMYGSEMMQFENISEQEVAAMFDYIENRYQTGFQDDQVAENIVCGINPAKIKAIWDERFENTLVATREFEERLKAIHITFDPSVLDLYINNLDKPLYYIDSLAALRWPWHDMTNLFTEFAARHDGRVKNASPELQLLKSYYERRSKAFTEAIAKAQNEFWEKQAQLDNEAAGKKTEHMIDSMKQATQNFVEEFTVNVKEAYRQLGYEVFPPANVYRVQVNNTGWNNVDKYVYESTATRTTLNYTDPKTGKKAVINYTPFSLQIEQWNKYDQLYVYLLPDKLSSFMRINGTDGKYTEKLNELINYKLVCVGYKGEQAYLYTDNSIQAKDYVGITFTAVGKSELDQELNNLGSASQSTSLKKENDYFLFNMRDEKRQKHNLALQELTNRVRDIIFPCYYLAPR